MSKTVIITGASRGIGRVTALRFARSGHNIVAVARNADNLNTLANEIKSAGGKCEIVAGDVSQRSTADEAVSRATAQFGRVDVLVNNAGIAPLYPVEEMPVDEFEKCVAINIDGVFHMTQAAWPVMYEQNAGTIVSISSRSSVDPFPGFAVYGACKAWVNIFTHAIAAEGKSVGIRAFAVAPGGVETGMFRELFPDVPEEKILKPENVAALIESVCGEAFDYSSGQTIFISQ